jgi:hypothetical protein
MVARAEQHRLSFKVNACLAVFQDTLNDVLDLRRFISRHDQLRPLTGWFI